MAKPIETKPVKTKPIKKSATQDRLYLKIEDLDWDDEAAIEAYAGRLYEVIARQFASKTAKDIRSQGRDEKEGDQP